MSTEDPVLADVESALVDLLQDSRDADPKNGGNGLKSATQIWTHTFSTLSAQEVASEDGLPIRDLFRLLAFQSAVIAITCRKLIAAQDELKAVKSIYNLP